MAPAYNEHQEGVRSAIQIEVHPDVLVASGRRGAAGLCTVGFEETRSHEFAGCWPLRSAPAPKNSVVTSYVACTDNGTVSVSNLFAPGHASSSSHSVVPSYLKLQIKVASLMLIQKRMPTLKSSSSLLQPCVQVGHYHIQKTRSPSGTTTAPLLNAEAFT